MTKLKEVLFLITLFIMSCNSNSQNSSITFRKVFDTNSKIEFCQINQLPNQKRLLTFSAPFTTGGGYALANFEFFRDSVNSNILLDVNHKVLSNLIINKNDIFLIEEDLHNNQLKSLVFSIRDIGKNRSIVDIPIDRPRKILINKEKMVVEGDKDGTGQSFIKDSLSSNYWKNISHFFNYKSFHIIENIGNTDKILGIGAKDYNDKNCELVTADLSTMKIKVLTQLDDIFSYIIPMAPKQNIIGKVMSGKIRLFSISGSELKFHSELILPRQIESIQRIFIDNNIIIVTGNGEELFDKALSWVSYNLGRSWEPFFQEEEIKLVDSDDGNLYVRNSKGVILLCKYP